MNIQLGRFPSQRQLFKPKLFPPSYTGPWGSLVSFVLGVHVTPVQIWAGPLSASLITTFAQSSQHSIMHRGYSASLNATQMHLNQAVGYYNWSRGRSRPSRFPPSQTATSGGGEGPAECPGVSACACVEEPVHCLPDRYASVLTATLRTRLS